MKKLKLFLSALTFVFIIVNFASAKDVDPPVWRTNAVPGLTVETWELLTDANPSPPDLVSNVYGMPSYENFAGEFTNNLPNPDSGNPTPVSGWYFPYEENGIMVEIPNDPTPNPTKKIRMQITSDKGPASISISGDPSLNLVSNTYTMSWQHSGTPWYTYVYDYIIEPNPNTERITISFPPQTIIEEIVVDTWCLPEPSILIILLSALFFYKIRG